MAVVVGVAAVERHNMTCVVVVAGEVVLPAKGA
jgi:hypothetical protein